jgi:hypothetical protein
MTPSAAARSALVALSICLGSCVDPPTEPLTPSVPSSFERIEREIFATSCAVSGCHAGLEPAGDMRLDAGRAYASLVDVPARNGAARSEGLLRVLPASVERSFLVRKLTGMLSDAHGARMPLGSSPLHPSAIEFIREWIAAGAPREGNVADTSLLHHAHGHGGDGVFEPLAPPSHGFQLHVPPFTVRPHGEREIFFATPPPIATASYMTGFRVTMRDNSHHFTLYSIPPGGTPLPLGVHRDRGTNNDEFLRVRSFLFGTQESDVSYSLPPGVGVAIDPRDFMDVNVHAVNPTDDSIVGESYVNVFTAEHVDRVAEPLLWSFHKFVLPAHREQTLHDTLLITDAQDLLMLTTHFHRHGKAFLIYLADETGERKIYDNREWDHPVIGRYDTPIPLRPGSRLRLEATYVNDTNVDIYYGATSEDEMCAIFGLVVKR